MQLFKYPDGSITGEKWFEHNGVNVSKKVLVKKVDEDQSEWCARLWDVYGVRPARYDMTGYDPATQLPGIPDETVDSNGFLVISFPSSVNKEKCWCTSTKEVLYLDSGETIPGTHTSLEPPSDSFAFWDGDSWEIDLVAKKDHKKTEIQEEKKRVRDGGVTVDGVLFDTDIPAQVAYGNFARKLSSDSTYESLVWKASAGVYVTMNATKLAQVEAAGEQLLADVFTWQKTQDEAVDAATTATEIEAVSTEYVSPGVDLSNK